MVFHWSLSDSKFPQVSKHLLSIRADLNNAIVWMISTRLVISKSSNLPTNPLVTEQSSPITISVTFTFMFHNLFNSLARSRYLSLFSPSFSFTLRSARTPKSNIQQVLFFSFFFFFFCCCWLSLALVVWLGLDDPFVSQDPREFYASHFPGQILEYVHTICSYGQI